MTKQIAVKLPDELLETVDRLVDEGLFVSRSAAVRAGLTAITHDRIDETIRHAFARGFRNTPETDQEMRDSERLAIESINEEPWEPWW